MSAAFIRFFYNAALLLVLILGSPWWLLRYAASQKFRAGLLQRFFGPSRAFAAALPPSPRLWLHAVSVGEVLAVSGLVSHLKQRSPGLSIVLSTTTRTGYALAQERFGPAGCFYFPLDFPWSVATVFKRLHPALLVLAESELWPNVLAACKRAEIPVAVVNARVSDRSLPRYLRLRRVWRPFLQTLTAVLAQTSEDARRLRQIGVPGSSISVGGNLKFDVRAPAGTRLTLLLRTMLPAAARLLVCGSTLEGEEAILLAAWPRILAAHPDAILLLAPRHPERFEAVAALLRTSAACWVRRSAWIADPRPLAGSSIFLLDSIGDLASLYSLASIAFIGGSLVPAGGHNPLEAAQFGVPILMGPHYENFRGVIDLFLARDAIRILRAGNVAESITNLLDRTEDARALGRNAQQLFEEQAGATARAADTILALLASRAAP